MMVIVTMLFSTQVNSFLICFDLFFSAKMPTILAWRRGMLVWKYSRYTCENGKVPRLHNTNFRCEKGVYV